MYKVEKMICKIKDEICGAMEYAEEYSFYKTTKPDFAAKYQKMAEQEVNHADYLHSMYQEKINNAAYLTEEDIEKWDKCTKKLTEKIALVRLILSK